MAAPREAAIVAVAKSSPDMRKIAGELRAFNVAHAGRWRAKSVSFALRDGAGRVRGGVSGHMVFGWLFVEMLFVAEAWRGKGHGGRLLAAAEARARKQGAHGVFLDTTSFQAEDFYRRCGYIKVGQIDDFPPGSSLMRMTKHL